jgi:hypothetical protein
VTERGSFNHLTICLGRRGTGKSTRALEVAVELSRYCYVLVVDPAWSFPSRLPGERVDRVARHDDTGSAVAAIEREGGGIQVTPDVNPDHVLVQATAVAKRSLDANDGQRGVPVVVVVDEAVLWQSSDPTRAGRVLTECVALGRHRNVGIVLTCQSSRLLTYQLLTLATEIDVFRTRDWKALKRLAETCGLEEAWLQRARDLPRFRYLAYYPDDERAEERSTGA